MIEQQGTTEVVKWLVDLLGRRAVAYITRLSSTEKVVEWLNGEVPSPEDEAVMRAAFESLAYIVDREGTTSAAVWFVGTNVALNFDSPADVLHESGVTRAEAVSRSARSFVSRVR